MRDVTFLRGETSMSRKAALLKFFWYYAILCFILAESVASQDEKACVDASDGGGECEDTASLEHPSLLQQARDFGHFLEHIFEVNDSYDGTNRTEQELVVLKAVFEYVKMDPSVLLSTTETTLADNWYCELVSRITALAPLNVFFTIYKGRPTEEQVKLVAAMDARAVERASRYAGQDATMSFEDEFRHEAFRPFRHRGGTTRQGSIFQRVVYNPLTYWVGFAIPNQAVLDAIASVGSPLVEMGAGTGYWSALLQNRGVDILAYDSEPPTANKGDNIYFHHTFTTVLPGTCTEILTNRQHAEYANRALLLVWPNNGDNVDNQAFSSPSLPPVWDVDCLKAYMAIGGKTVVFVGEREENVPRPLGAPRESGMTATREFQELLKENFELVEQIDIPHWWNSDDATIWRKR